MKVFQDLELQGDRDSIRRLMEEIKANLSGGWTHAEDIERRYSLDVGKDTYCFSCTRAGSREPATLFSIFSEPNRLAVGNIISHGNADLTPDQYNHILGDFYERFIHPRAEKMGILGHPSPVDMSIEEIISRAAAERLKNFSRMANKSTGGSHPLDRERWFEFLVTMHKEKQKLDWDILFRWLVEDEGWPEEVADDLTSEYEFARSLLEFYDGNRQ